MSVKTQAAKTWVGAIAAIGLVSVAVIVYREGAPARAASEFLDDVLHERWGAAYGFMGTGERTTLNMSGEEFSRFCQEISAAGWPRADHADMEEMIPYVPPNALSDTTWNLKGTHRFSITLRRPDGSVHIHVDMDYRHDPSGEWHPDVLPFILSISRGTPEGNPVKGLLNAMNAIGFKKLETYPFHQRTTIHELDERLKHQRKFYLETPAQPFH